MALKSIVKKPVTPEKQFLDLIDRGAILANHDEDKRQKEKRRKFFSGSNIGYCIRQLYYKKMKEEEKKEGEPGFLKKVNFGSKLHELYQDYLQHSGHLFGNWYCKYCQKITGPSYSPTDRCDCERAPVGKLPKYSELSIIHPKLRVAGHPDGFVKIDKKLVLIEIKTISPYRKIGDSIDNVKKYVPEHIRQANFYSGLLQDEATMFEEGTKDLFLSLFNSDYYLLVYSDKGSDETIPYRFNFNPTLFEDDKERVRKYWKALKEQTPPDAEPGMGGCKYCRFIDDCNALKGH